MDKFKEEVGVVEIKNDDGNVSVELQGCLKSSTCGTIWTKVISALDKADYDSVVINAERVYSFDGGGAALLAKAQNKVLSQGKRFEIINLRPEFKKLYSLIESDPTQATLKRVPKMKFKYLVTEIGKASLGVFHDMAVLLSFVGELTAALFYMIIRPDKVRWKDVTLVAEKMGANAFGIVMLLGFLIGLILAFQSAIPLKQFGAQIYVADLVAISVIRELGPLITAVILTGRTGSAFAAELGTMKINEEIDALTTMGLDPVRFLTVSRISAVVAITPVLTVFANLFALVGCGVVMLSLGFPLVSYLTRLEIAVTITDFAGGMVKSLVFGFLIAAVGCLRGLQTESGASAVGNSATRAVVSGIILIVIADGIFAVMFYYLGI